MTATSSGIKMKLAQHTYTHAAKGFNLEVVVAGKRFVTTKNVETGEEFKFRRCRFVWMIKEGVLVKNHELSEP